MTWRITEFGEDRFGNTELKTFLSDKSHNWISDGCHFVIEGMGVGHFYLEIYSMETGNAAAKIFYNENCSVCIHDPCVATWGKHG